LFAEILKWTNTPWKGSSEYLRNKIMKGSKRKPWATVTCSPIDNHEVGEGVSYPKGSPFLRNYLQLHNALHSN